MSDARGAGPYLGVRFGDGPAEAVNDIVVPVVALGERAVEEFGGRGEFFRAENGVRLFRSGGVVIGHLRAPVAGATLAVRTEELYAKLLAAVGARALVRIWNYVPQINAERDSLENYRGFCVGRSRAFERAFGAGGSLRLPAATAVGCGGEELIAIFVAGGTEPRHFENPQQVPAYEYPVQHGPRSPSFARATVVEEGGWRFVFVSGTAAIRGHETVGAGSLSAQLDCTLENLQAISRAAGLGEGLTLGGAERRRFKVYLRHRADYERTRERLERTLLRAGDEAIYLQADICRAELDVEIEVTVIAPV